MELTKYETNLIAKLLEDRVAECNRNALDCTETNAPAVAYYLNEQKAIASNLAVKYREEGKA